VFIGMGGSTLGSTACTRVVITAYALAWGDLGVLLSADQRTRVKNLTPRNKMILCNSEETSATAYKTL
jgi:hypothetical protein